MSEKLQTIIDTELGGQDPRDWVEENHDWLSEWLTFTPACNLAPRLDHRRFQRFMGHGLEYRNKQLLTAAVFSLEYWVDPEGIGPGPLYHFPGFYEQENRLPTPDDEATFAYVDHREQVINRSSEHYAIHYDGMYRLHIIDTTDE